MKKKTTLPALLVLAGTLLQLPVNAAAASNVVGMGLPSVDLFGSLFTNRYVASDMGMILAGMAFLMLMVVGALVVLTVAVFSGKKPEEEDVELLPPTPVRRYPDITEGETEPLRRNTLQTEDKPFLDGVIEVISGPMRGCMIPIHHGETLYFGKNPRVCHVIFPYSYTKVSRMHCMITYDAAAKRYYVIDCSTNGTYVGGRTRARAGEKTAVAPKTVLTLADDSCTILLG